MTGLTLSLIAGEGKKPWLGYDLIEGGVANDRIFDTIENYMVIIYHFTPISTNSH